jgi:hypothetical protein
MNLLCFVLAVETSKLSSSILLMIDAVDVDDDAVDDDAVDDDVVDDDVVSAVTNMLGGWVE